MPGEVLARPYGAPGVIFPSKTTLWRVLTGADPAAVDAAVGAWLAEQAAATTSAPETPAGAHAPGLVAVAVGRHDAARGGRPRGQPDPSARSRDPR